MPTKIRIVMRKKYKIQTKLNRTLQNSNSTITNRPSYSETIYCFNKIRDVPGTNFLPGTEYRVLRRFFTGSGYRVPGV